MTSSNISGGKFAPFYNPVSLKEPNETDKKIDATLIAYMETEMKIASDDEMRRRDAILAQVKQIFLKWVQHVAVQELNMAEDEAEEAGGDIFISGSHRLGVRDIGADIDAVCIAPNFCTKEHFFRILKEDFIGHPDVTDLVSIEEATVPIMSFDFRKVSIDLLFARLVDNVVPKNLDILDDRILIGLDVASEKSLNGPRVTNMIPELVGKKTLPNFRVVLRCIRRWAKCRGIYGNKLGYLGGVNCNLLVALVCQLYPNGSPSTLLHRFFYIYSQWQWPKPVKLNQIQPNPPGEDREIWNERDNPYHVMPIITPAYPAMNSTANVSLHSLEVIRREFQRGDEVMKEIINDRGQHWERLFAPSDFFIRYQHYLSCHIIGIGEDEASRSWIGFIESRIRHLATSKYLGALPIKMPIHLHPVISKTKKSEKSVCYFIGFNIDPTAFAKNKNLYLDECLTRFTESMNDPDRGYRGPRRDGLDFFVEHHPWKRLPAEVFESIGGKEAAKQLRISSGFAVEKKIVEAAKLSVDQTSSGAVDSEGKAATSTAAEKTSEVDVMKSELAAADSDLNRKRDHSEVEEDTSASEELQKIQAFMSKVPRLLPPKKAHRKLIIPNVTWTFLESK